MSYNYFRKQLKSIPKNLPDSIKELNISSNKITEIEKGSLPDSIKKLNISSNKIIEIEKGSLPNLIEELDVSNNEITEIEKGSLPNSLKKLNISSNKITKIEKGSLPDSIEILNITDNKITKIEKGSLPNSLKTLFISINKITKIEKGNLPNSLKKLYISNNEITEIEKGSLPNSIEILSIFNNKITEIEKGSLPNSIEELTIFDNKITKIEKDSLPESLKELYAYNNPICVTHSFLCGDDIDIEGILKWNSSKTFKKTGKEILSLIKGKKIFKWQEICASLGDEKIQELKEIGKLYKIDTEGKNKREICMELAKKLEKKMKIDISDCNNDSSILGDSITDIYKPFLIKIKDNEKIYCFNILELKESINKGETRNPYTRNELPVDIINKKYEKLKKLTIPSKFTLTNIIEQIKNTPILTKEVLQRQKIIDLFSKMHYTGDIEIFMNAPIERYNQIFNDLVEYGLEIKKQDHEMYKNKVNLIDKRNVIIDVLIRLYNIDDEQRNIRLQTIETILFGK